MGDLIFSNLNFDHSCTYKNKKYTPNMDSSKYLAELKTYCNKIKPFFSHYSKLIKSYNATVYNILTNEIRLLWPCISKQKCGIVSTLVSDFIGLAYEGISSFLQSKCEDALQKAMIAMNNEVNLQHNKLLKLDNTMLMYVIYNAETLEKLINTVQEIHNVTSPHERLYAFDSLLFLRIVQDKYISFYKELIAQLKSYFSAIRILTKGYLPTTLITPSKLQEILAEVTKSLQQTNPDFALVLDRLHLYYDMQLVTFGIDREMNLVIWFPVFIQPYIQKPLILYQLETMPVPILDTNMEAQSYIHLRVNKPYIALNTETYIMHTQQELRSCKKIGNEFYCKELFVVKHKSSYGCESAIYFNLTTDIIRKNCNFDFYYNKTDITPIVLDGGDEIILVNWPNDKHIICNIKNDIPVKILSHPYVLVNRSILCNCGIEADSHHLLESLTVCDNKLTKLTMYFTINLAFSNYLELMPYMTDQLPINRGKTDFEQPLPIYLNNLHFENLLSDRPGKLKEFI